MQGTGHPVHSAVVYASSVWDPSTNFQDDVEKVQNHAARFVTGNFSYETGSMTGILEKLKWESVKKRRKQSRLILLYKGLKGKASYPQMTLFIQTFTRSVSSQGLLEIAMSSQLFFYSWLNVGRIASIDLPTW